MPSEISSTAKQSRRSEAFAVVAQSNGERFVWNRDNEKGYFLRQLLWPQCTVEERSVHPWHAHPAVPPTEVDRIFVRYVRQKLMCDTLLRTSGRGGSRERSSPWLAAVIESAKELDFLTTLLAHTVQRSRSEELMASLEGLPLVTESWSFCKNPDATRALRSARRSSSSSSSSSANEALNNELVILYTSPDHDHKWTQLLFRSGLDVTGFQDLGQMDVFYDAQLIEGRRWQTVSEERGVEEVQAAPNCDRSSPHCVALVAEVLLAHRRERFANVLSLAQAAAARDTLLLDERDALRREVAIYRRQLIDSSTTRSLGQPLPHYAEAIWTYRLLVQQVLCRAQPDPQQRDRCFEACAKIVASCAQVKGLYYRFVYNDSSRPNDGSSDLRQGLFSKFVCGAVATMFDAVTNRNRSLLHNALSALGNLETPEHASRSTRDGFDVYCRLHWRKLFLNHLTALQCPASVSQVKSQIAELASSVGVEGKPLISLFDAMFERLWEVTVVMFLQRPQLRFGNAGSKPRDGLCIANYELLDGAVGYPGDPGVVVIIPHVVKRTVYQKSGVAVWEAVEKGRVDLKRG